MKIKSLFVNVPTDGYGGGPGYVKRLEFASENGFNNIIFTGDGANLPNMDFLKVFCKKNHEAKRPFYWIELHCLGNNLAVRTLDILKFHGVTTISVLLNSIFSDAENADFGPHVNIEELCGNIKQYDFTLRLNLNLTHFYNKKSPEEIFERANKLGADQVTFRVHNVPKFMPQKNKKTVIRCESVEDNILKYIRAKGNELGALPSGARICSVNGISTVFDNYCINTKKDPEELTELFLHENGKLYRHWHDKGSRVF